MCEIKNCEKCGKIFKSYFSKSLCPICSQYEEDTFDIIREYLYESYQEHS